MSSFVELSTDALVTDLPIRLHSVVLTSSSGGVGDVTVYAGKDTISGRSVGTVKTAASSTRQVIYTGLELQEGLFVDVGSNVTSVTIEFSFLC